MLFELINPSDKITLEAENWAVASACAWMLSSMFWVEDEDWKNRGSARFCDKEYVESVLWDPKEFAKNNKEAMKKCFSSFMYGSFSDYRNFQKALSLIDSEEKKEEYKKFNEDTRSSLNAIVKAARELAEKI